MENKAYKTELQVNNKQVSYFTECAGVARFVYNWALDYWIEEYKAGNKRTSWMKLGTELTKQKQSEFTWMYKYSNWIRTYALKNCDQAYQNFFRNVKNGKTPGFPKFKSRKTSPKKFTIVGEKIKLTETKVKLPIIGWIKLKEHGYIPTNKKVVSATISEKNRRWYISVLVEEALEQTPEPEKIIGVDLGIKHLAVTSEGTYYENPKTLYKYERKLKLLDRRVSRKIKGSKNREKAKLIRAKTHEKIARIREHYLHEVTTELARTKPVVIVIEDLNVSGMKKNHHLAKAISDASFAEFRRMLEYKCAWYGSELVVVDRFFPSSKTCSNCGAIKDDLMLNDRIFKCSDCGFEIDRDLNAAINLKNRVKHTRIDACGEGNVRPVDSLWAASLKQEVGCEVNYA